jgi:2-desacetyl-2-hydroxyethyl bacteriochlorophyllide A dehydrogenase
MKALTFDGIEKINYESIADPSILSPTDAIVKVKLCAICGSDLHVYYGREKGIDHHTAMGHEFMGEIVDTGRDVKTLKKGDVVMSPFTTSCGRCFYCKIGLTCRCVQSQLFGWVENGAGLQGGQSEFVRVPLADSTLVKVPDGISPEEALLLGDVMSTGFFAAKQGITRAEESCVVIGCGPVGLMAVTGAIHYNAKQVFAVDGIPGRLTMAENFGASALNASDPDLKKKILDATDGRGADAVLEAVGSASAVQLAFDLVRPGGIVASVGVCNDPDFPFSPVEAYNKNLTYKSGRCPARHMMNELIPVVQSGKYPLDQVFTHHMTLKEGVGAYDKFANKKDGCLKVVLTTE